MIISVYCVLLEAAYIYTEPTLCKPKQKTTNKSPSTCQTLGNGKETTEIWGYFFNSIIRVEY